MIPGQNRRGHRNSDTLPLAPYELFHENVVTKA